MAPVVKNKKGIRRVQVHYPKPISQSVASAMGGRISPIASLVNDVARAEERKRYKAFSWDEIKALERATIEFLHSSIKGIAEASEAVAVAGCDNIEEFIVLSNATQKDIADYTQELKDINKLHEGKSGQIQDENDYLLYLKIGELYSNFSSLSGGTLNHTLISYTDFALQAKDRIKAGLVPGITGGLAAEAAASNEAPADSEVPVATETQSTGDAQ